MEARANKMAINNISIPDVSSTGLPRALHSLVPRLNPIWRLYRWTTNLFRFSLAQIRLVKNFENANSPIKEVQLLLKVWVPGCIKILEMHFLDFFCAKMHDFCVNANSAYLRFTGTIRDKSVENIVENRTTSRKPVVRVQFQAASSPIRCSAKSSSHEQRCMREGEWECGWQFQPVVYQHISWICIFYKVSQEVSSLIVGTVPRPYQNFKPCKN